MTKETDADALDTLCRKDRARLPELRAVLDELAFEDHGVRWRYVPAGAFVMGDDAGNLDERPAHTVTIVGFYMSEAPIAVDDTKSSPLAFVGQNNRDPVRLNVQPRAPRELALRTPCVALTFNASEELAHSVQARLPSEAEWERAARGCREGALYPWGDEPPDETRAQFAADVKQQQTAPPSRGVIPNDYGLFAMAGGVWEWCSDAYDAVAYAQSTGTATPFVVPNVNPDRCRRVLRGGSFLDGADALRVSFRCAAHTGRISPVIGTRLVRDRKEPSP